MAGLLNRRYATAVVVLAMSAWIALTLWERDSDYDYLAADQGHYLFGAGRIIAGEVPYRDFVWHYGPLPLYSLAVVAKFVGATPLAFELHQSLWNVAAAFLCIGAMRKWFGPGVGLAAFLLTSFGWLSSFGFLYAPVEKVALFALAALWRDPADRTVRYSLSVGALLGLMQGIKFATAFVAGAAWLLVDLLVLKAASSRPVPIRRWLEGSLWIAGGFALVQGGWIAGGFLVLGDAAGQFLWPTFHLQWYQSYVTAETRWFRFQNLGYFLGVQLPFLVCLGLTCGVLLKWAVGRAPSPTAVSDASPRPFLPALLLPLVYLIGCAVFIKHVYNQIAYMWLLCPAVGLGLAHRGKGITTALVLALLPSALLIPREAVRSVQRARANEGGLAWYDTQRGGGYWLSPDELAATQGFGRQVLAHAEITNAPGVIVGPNEKLGVHIGSGLYAAFRLQSAIHNPWLFEGAAQVAGGESEFIRYREARWMSVKLPSSLERASSVEQRDYVTRQALPFDVGRNGRILEAYEAPVGTGDGWLFYRATPRAGETGSR